MTLRHVVAKNMQMYIVTQSNSWLNTTLFLARTHRWYWKYLHKSHQFDSCLHKDFVYHRNYAKRIKKRNSTIEGHYQQLQRIQWHKVNTLDVMHSQMSKRCLNKWRSWISRCEKARLETHLTRKRSRKPSRSDLVIPAPLFTKKCSCLESYVTFPRFRKGA